MGCDGIDRMFCGIAVPVGESFCNASDPTVCSIGCRFTDVVFAEFRGDYPLGVNLPPWPAGTS